MSEQPQKKSSAADNTAPQKIDLAGAMGAPQSSAPQNPAQPLAPATPAQPELPHIALKDAQAPAHTPAPAQAAPPAAPPVAAKPDQTFRAKAAEPQPQAPAPTEPKLNLKKELDDLRADIEQGRTSRRLQVLRQAGVEVLTDSELLKLSPKVDPDSDAGGQELSKWIADHQSLVSPRYRTRPSPGPAMLDKAKDQRGLMHVFKNAETLEKTLKNYFDEG